MYPQNSSSYIDGPTGAGKTYVLRMMNGRDFAIKALDGLGSSFRQSDAFVHLTKDNY